MLDLFLQFVQELARAILVDELSGRVRRHLTRWFGSQDATDCRRAVLGVHRRNRDRLLHRLITEIDQDL